VSKGATLDAQAARLVPDSTHADLIAQITATPYQRSERRGRSAAKPPLLTRRRLAIGLPATAAIAAAAIALASAGYSGQHAVPDNVVPGNVVPVKAEVLSFIKHGGYIDVVVRDPLADEKRYNAEFKAHGLNITLRLVPASPSLVGTVVYFDGSSAIKPITAQGKCWTGGGGSSCPVGLRVPVDFHGAASLVFGRAARPAERYETTAPATARGEMLYGLHIAGQRVAVVLAMLRARHVMVGAYNFLAPNGLAVLGHQVPLSWFVHEADPWAPGQVMLFVGKTNTEPISNPPSKLPAPKVTPSRSA
jgi:hypothetical protein